MIFLYCLSMLIQKKTVQVDVLHAFKCSASVRAESYGIAEGAARSEY